MVATFFFNAKSLDTSDNNNNFTKLANFVNQDNTCTRYSLTVINLQDKMHLLLDIKIYFHMSFHELLKLGHTYAIRI